MMEQTETEERLAGLERELEESREREESLKRVNEALVGRRQVQKNEHLHNLHPSEDRQSQLTEDLLGPSTWSEESTTSNWTSVTSKSSASVRRWSSAK